MTLLITRPLYELTTHYLFYWNKKVINLAKTRGYKVLDLHTKKANKKTFTSYIRSRQPNLVLLNGHGSSDFVSGQNNEIIIKVGDNERLLKNKIVYALSCKTGQILGPKSVQAGAVSYIGYKEDFNFWGNSTYSARPLSDPRAKLFFVPSNQIGISLLKGHTVENACKRAKNTFLKNVQKLVVTNSSDQFIIPDLLWNMTHLHYFGNAKATI